MESRVKDIAQHTKENIKETAQQWAERAKTAGSAASEKVKAGAMATDATIREYPYAALGIAFGCGLLIGFLARRK